MLFRGVNEELGNIFGTRLFEVGGIGCWLGAGPTAQARADYRITGQALVW